ncbi:MAG TPA: response regulator FixJ [Phenylobacterium sp.]
MTNQTVYIVDDDEGVRGALRFLLEAARIEVRLFESAVDFLREAESLAPGCIVTDVRMPEIDGLELVRRLKAQGLPHPVIVITGHGDIPLAVEAMKAGALDFLEKPFEDDVLLGSIRAALDADEHAAKAEAAKRTFEGLLASLSPREQEVLHGVVAGKLSKTIAHELGISPRTVEIYRANMMMKTQAKSLSELVRMALLAGL